jgi:hypothetical protein
MRTAALLMSAVALLSGCATVAEGATATMRVESAPTPVTTPEMLPTPTPGGSSASSPASDSPATTPTSPAPVASDSASGPPSSAAGNSAPPPDPAPSGSFVLGDSIGLGVAPLLSRYGFPVTGRVGQSAHAAFLQQHLSSAAAQAAPGWVIVLGTNNRGDDGDLARLPDWIDLIASLRTRGAKQQVYWVTPHRPETYVGGLSRWSLQEFNAELQRLADERRWLHVIDFDTVAAAHPEWFAEDSGRLHPNREGQAVLAALIAGPDGSPASRPAPITTLEWPTPTPSPTSAPEEGELFDNSSE